MVRTIHAAHVFFQATYERGPPRWDIGRQPQIFAVHPSLGVSSVAEYVDHAKKNSGVGFATSGFGTNQHVVGAWFAKEANIKLDHVPHHWKV